MCYFNKHINKFLNLDPSDGGNADDINDGS